MALQEQIEADIRDAMKQQKKDELLALRAIKSAIFSEKMLVMKAWAVMWLKVLI